MGDRLKSIGIHIARYGLAIVKESRRLTEMIGQVLAYGGNADGFWIRRRE